MQGARSGGNNNGGDRRKSMRRRSVREDCSRLGTPRTQASRAKAYSQGLVSEIMKDLDPPMMRKVRRDFDEIGDGEVELKQFVKIMQHHLPHLEEADLCELFLEIDVNGDGTLEWDELTAFIVEKSSMYHSGSQNDFYVPYKFAFKQENRALFDENLITKLTYIDQVEAVAVLRNHVKSIYLYDTRDFGSELGRLTGYKGIPICCEYIPSQVQHNSSTRIQPGSLVAACSNLTLTRWELAPGESQFSVHSCWPTPHAQAALRYVEKYKTLFSASVAGMIHLWDIDKRSEKACITNAHSDIASALTELNGLDCIASGGMDSEVYIWDVNNCGKRQGLHGHKNGVYTMTYNESHKLLVTGGIDHDALVWSPFSPMVIYKLTGHQESLVEIRNVPGSEHQLISADVSGTFKVWDLRKYKCLQTFTDDPPYHLKNGMTSFVVTAGFDMQKEKKNIDLMSETTSSLKAPYLSRIVASTKKLHIFDQCDPVTEMVTDSIPIIQVLINTVSMTILTATGRSVRIWDLLTGKQLRKYENLTETDITSVCLDDRQRKFLIGDHSGKMKVFNYSSGAFMKYLDPHKAEVSQMVYCGKDKTVVSVSWDRNIFVHSELEAEHGIKLCQMDVNLPHEGDVTCCHVEGDRVVTGSLDKTVRLWDRGTGKLYGKLSCGSDVSSISFIHNGSAFVASDHAGRMHLWLTKLQNCESTHVVVNNTSCLKEIGGCSILTMKWEPKSAQLFTGDEFGGIACWKISKDLQNIDVVWYIADAHDDGITSIDTSGNYGFIVSSGFDCCVKAFNIADGSNQGTLVDGAGRGMTRSVFWNVPVDADVLEAELNAVLPSDDESDDDDDSDEACDSTIDQKKDDHDYNNHNNGEQKEEKGHEQKNADEEKQKSDEPETSSLEEQKNEDSSQSKSSNIVFDENAELEEKQDKREERRKILKDMLSLPF